MNRIWAISGFDDGPHWDEALIAADSEDEARALLAARLAEHAGPEGENDGPKYIDTVWQPQPQESWRVREIDGPILLILGCGCR